MNSFVRWRWFTVFLLCTFITLQAVLLSLISSYQTQRADAVRLNALQHLATQRAQLEGLINANLVSMWGLRAEIMSQAEVDTQRFSALAGYLLDDNLHTRHIAVAPDLVIRYIYPLTGNERALGLDYREVSSQYDSVLQAIEYNDVVIQHPIKLAQGGEAMIARIPVVMDSGEVWGIISQVFDHQRLFSDAGIGHHDNTPFLTALRSGDQHLAGEHDVWTHQPISLDVHIGNQQWQLGAFPADGNWRQPLPHFWPWLALGNLMIAAILVLFILVFINHRRLRRAFDLITQQAQTDPLTGLLNRKHLRHLLENYITYCESSNEAFCVLFIDLDHFKQINDSLGHEAGDQLLTQVAQRLRERLRDRDLTARLGGDEFVVVLKQVCDLETSLSLANQLQQTLATPFEVAGHRLHIHSSIGIALYPSDGKDVTTLLKHADAAMYSAKAAGRNTSAFFDADMQHSAERQLQLSESIRLGLERNEFCVHYQPIVARDGSVSHIEALLRWQHPEHGLLSPAHFIDNAEHSGAIHGLGDFVLAQSCKDLSVLKQYAPSLKLAVNRSSVEFNDAANPKRWLRLIHSAKVSPSDIIFEITESILMPQQARQQLMIEHLQQEGIVFAIDDFGTGYSSVNYIRRFPIELLKVDQSFTATIPADTKATAMMSALVQMAQALDIQLVAEGVADKQQANCLIELGVDYLQGYYYSPPLPLEQLKQWLQTSAPNTK